MTEQERVSRLKGFASRVRGVERCLDNVRRAQLRADRADVVLWLDQGECYAGLITAAEFNARHS